jgi:hypothetical protein
MPPLMKARGGCNTDVMAMHASSRYYMSAQGSLPRWADTLKEMKYQQLEALNRVCSTNRIELLNVG